MTEMNTIVACCQIPVVLGDSAGNRSRAYSAVVAAATAGAQVVVLPELVNTGYMFTDMDELRSEAEPVNGPTIQEWIKLASEHKLIIVGGFAELGPDGLVYNSAALVDETGVRSVYRKAHLWDRERDDLFTAGSDLPPLVETSVGRIGVMICYDLEFPEWVRMLALQGVDLLCAPVNWPIFPRPDGERPTEIVKVQANCSINRIAIAAADRVGTERGQEWLGGSVVVNADGYPVTGIRLGEETVLIATLNLAESRNKRISARNDVHVDRQPYLYSSLLEAKNTIQGK